METFTSQGGGLSDLKPSRPFLGWKFGEAILVDTAKALTQESNISLPEAKSILREIGSLILGAAEIVKRNKNGFPKGTSLNPNLEEEKKEIRKGFKPTKEEAALAVQYIVLEIAQRRGLKVNANEIFSQNSLAIHYEKDGGLVWRIGNTPTRMSLAGSIAMAILEDPKTTTQDYKDKYLQAHRGDATVPVESLRDAKNRGLSARYTDAKDVDPYDLIRAVITEDEEFSKKRGAIIEKLDKLIPHRQVR